MGWKDVCVGGEGESKARPWGQKRRLGGRYVKFTWIQEMDSGATSELPSQEKDALLII